MLAFPPDQSQRVEEPHLLHKTKSAPARDPVAYYPQTPGRRPREHADRRHDQRGERAEGQPHDRGDRREEKQTYEVRGEDVVQRTRRAVERPPAEQWAQREGDEEDRRHRHLPMPRPERNDDGSERREREHRPRFQTFQLRGGRVGLRLVALRGRALDLHGVLYNIWVEGCLHINSSESCGAQLLGCDALR